MKKEISTKDAPSAPQFLSQGIEINDTVYVSRQIHCKPDGSMVESTDKNKVTQIMQNISGILEAAGTGLDNVVKVVI